MYFSCVKKGRDSIDTVVSSLPANLSVALPGDAFLVVIYGSELGKRIPLGIGAIDCGRAAQASISLDDDAVSRRHARFAWTGSNYIVTDLNSTNGTFVNDASVREQTLRDGDQIKIGRTIFKFIQGGNVELAYHEEIYRLMTFDGLTQVHNKRSFEAVLEREVSRSLRYARPLSLILFDIDHFKQINDKFGHLAGDTVLRQMAALVSANVRREDTLARVGGEEFALLAPEVTLDAAQAAAEKIRILVERTPCRFDEDLIPITSSFGVATLRAESMVSPTDLYKEADDRLYQAKAGGRNRVA